MGDENYLAINLGTMETKGVVCNTSKKVSFDHLDNEHGSHSIISNIAIASNGEQEPDKKGNMLPYSCVIGKCAENYQKTSPRVILPYTNAMIGLSFFSKTVQNIYPDLQYLIEPKFHAAEKKPKAGQNPFKVDDYDCNMVNIVVKDGKRKDYFDPIKIAALYLRTTLNQGNKKVQKAFPQPVIAIPGDAGFIQRQGYSIAAEMAGLRDFTLIPEPAAIAINYVYQQRAANPSLEQGQKHYLIIDIGGKSTKASVVRFENERFDVLSTVTDEDISSYQITKEIFNLANLASNYDIDFDKPEFRFQREELLAECESKKVERKLQEKTRLNFSSADRSETLFVTLKREEIKNSINEIFEDIGNLAKKAAEKAHVSSFDTLILAGATAANEYAVEAISKQLDKTPVVLERPQMAAVEGAGLLSAYLNDSRPIEGINKIEIGETVPVNLYVAAARGRLVKAVKAGTPYPAVGEELTFEGKKGFEICVYEGHSNLRMECSLVTRKKVIGSGIIKVRVEVKGPGEMPKIFAAVNDGEMKEVLAENINFKNKYDADKNWVNTLIPLVVPSK